METTVCDIWKGRDKLVNYAVSCDLTSGLSEQKTLKPSTYEEHDMLEWLDQKRAQGTPVSRIVCTKWNFLCISNGRRFYCFLKLIIMIQATWHLGVCHTRRKNKWQ
jgi:hypothetical protein